MNTLKSVVMRYAECICSLVQDLDVQKPLWNQLVLPDQFYMDVENSRGWIKELKKQKLTGPQAEREWMVSLLEHELAQQAAKNPVSEVKKPMQQFLKVKTCSVCKGEKFVGRNFENDCPACCAFGFVYPNGESVPYTLALGTIRGLNGRKLLYIDRYEIAETVSGAAGS
ncbi:hypothetical protein A8L34_28080 [Bacillus sp. FJAT-27264]|uniref:hypothetical protein n=1 Tax=Paenibacillus sp. (strain DSM 101736 / FJAT-27264) TaxID=1850362 RepID=UPI000807EDF4|nr:hypothetical protein [Bacillus sp. FJAT-27264]OBZ15908.1 hypothetical protein A8L34_28080 [Bacillus sp. FJAT-27264]